MVNKTECISRSSVDGYYKNIYGVNNARLSCFGCCLVSGINVSHGPF